MKRKTGFSLIEILVSSIILALLVSGTTVTYISIKKLARGVGYRYTAWNLAREILEFGETANFQHVFRMKYYYPGATTCTIPETGCDGPGCGSGLSASSGYGVKEWYFFCLSNPHPFTYLGNIKTQGLVPEHAKNSLVIYYKVEQDANFDNAYKETVEVSWQDETGESTKRIIASVIPIRQVNNQLQLGVAEFWWE